MCINLWSPSLNNIHKELMIYVWIMKLIDQWLYIITYSTCYIFLENNFGSFEEILSNYENLLSTSHWAAVEALF